MRINELNTFKYTNSNKPYVSRPVFKQNQSSGVVEQAIVDQFIESADDQKYAKSPLLGKLAYLKEVLFSSETTRRAKELQDVLDNCESSHNILYQI